MRKTSDIFCADKIFLNYIYIKFFFKVGAKSSIFKHFFDFFDPSKKRKPSVQKVPLYTIYMDFYQLKLICTHQAHQIPQKTDLVEVKNTFFGGFGVPGGCKSILNVKRLHKSYIAELFGPRGFCFSVGRKKSSIAAKSTILSRP